MYVEGAFDLSVVEWVLRQNNCDDATLYEIDTVHVPDEFLISRQLDVGQKARVILLCTELAGTVRSISQVTGIVDRDYDNLLKRSYDSPHLLFTDYACMEMYFCNEATLKKFLHFVSNGRLGDPGPMLAVLERALRAAFAIRAANEQLKLGMTRLDLCDQCDIDQGEIDFDQSEFIRKYLNKNAQLSQASDFVAQVEAFQAASAEVEFRRCVNGHDFIELLAKYVSKRVKNRHLANADIILKFLLIAMDYVHLSVTPMFAELLRRVCTREEDNRSEAGQDEN